MTSLNDRPDHHEVVELQVCNAGLQVFRDLHSPTTIILATHSQVQAHIVMTHM